MSSDTTSPTLRPPKPGTRFVLPALHGAAEALVLAQAARTLQAEGRMLVVVVADAPAAQRLLAEIGWFGKRHAQAGDPAEAKGGVRADAQAAAKAAAKADAEDDALRCHLLPDWETLPYDAFSPHQDLVSERLATLHEIRSGQCDVLIVPATTALVRMGPPSFLAGYTFFFKQGEKLTRRN